MRIYCLLLGILFTAVGALAIMTGVLLWRSTRWGAVVFDLLGVGLVGLGMRFLYGAASGGIPAAFGAVGDEAASPGVTEPPTG